MKMLKWALAAVTASMLVACGGGGNSGSPPFPCSATDGSCSSSSAAKTVDVLASTVQVGTGGDTITITATVKDKNNTALSGVAVSFSATSGSLSGATATTNASGVATATFASGGDRSNRKATVTVTSGSAKGTVDIDITGTVVSYSGVTTVALGQTVSVSAKAVDSKGAVISGLPITVASSLSNGLSSATITTDSSGTATVDYTATNAGSDVITFAGGGSTATPTVQVSSAQFTFLSPAANTQIPVTTSQAVTVQYLNAGSPVAGATVNFSATAGTVTPSSAVTDAMGRASVSVRSVTSSSAIVQASVGTTVQATLPVVFVAQAPSRIVLQVTPSSIGPNPTGSTSQAQLIASVTDVNANPVSGAVVAFNRLTDPSSGRLSQATATTDASGQATVQYIAGPLTTATNGIEVRADVQGTSVTTFNATPSLNRDAFITVSGSPITIDLSTGNVISNLDEQTYKKDWSVAVTDANGVGVANVSVTLKVIPTHYLKGQLAFTAGSWQYVSPIYSCQNEDYDPLSPTSPNNLNGILDPGEDFNGNGKLEPGNVVSLTVGTVVTGTNGRATFSLLYGEDKVPWVEVMLVAQARVSGTESTKSTTFIIDGAASDFTSATVPPAGRISPWKTQTCDVPPP